jgi:hypothetical protein
MRRMRSLARCGEGRATALPTAKRLSIYTSFETRKKLKVHFIENSLRHFPNDICLFSMVPELHFGLPRGQGERISTVLAAVICI